MITKTCSKCHGAGKSKDKQSVKIQIPAGIANGMRLKMHGHGDEGENGGPPGDLYVYIQVNEHEIFSREGDDLILNLPITFTEAALGAKKEIPTITGSACKVTIPEGTQSGKVLRVRAGGFKNVHGNGQGDMLVKITVETPVNLSADQKKFLREFAESEKSDNRPHSKSFFDKIKSCFK